MGCCKAGMNPRPAITIALGWLGAPTVLADEQPPVLQAGTDVYGNVAVPSLSATDVYFTCNKTTDEAWPTRGGSTSALSSRNIFVIIRRPPTRRNKSKSGPNSNINKLRE
jgi:hypothetical protein